MNQHRPNITAEEILRVPYLMSDDFIRELLRDGEGAVSSFLLKNVCLIDRFWHTSGNASLVMFATSSLSSRIEGKVPLCAPMAKLYMLEAEALVASASSRDFLVRAHQRSEAAQEILLGGQITPDTLELLSESILIAGVSLKAMGDFDDSLIYMRHKVRETGLNSIEAVALVRQEIMMFQDENKHLLLLNHAAEYRTSRPREYFRTVKRAMEFLVNHRRVGLADALAPEFGRAFVYARADLTFLGQLSFFRDVAQLYLLRGERFRALHMLNACLKMAESSHYAGQIRQIKALIDALADEQATPRLQTFRV